MAVRIDVDFRHGLAAARVAQQEDGSVEVLVTRGQETVVVHLAVPSLETLGQAVLMELTRLRR
jgi:hypothetical protein